MLIKPKKSLGQNFLKDKNIAEKIIRHFNPTESDDVVEIGPGIGVLTKYLAERCGTLYLVEKDIRAVDILNQNYGTLSNIEVIHRDILDLQFSSFQPSGNKKIRVIGNIPYYITSPIIFHVLDQRDIVFDMLIMMQLEVARRIVAQSGTSDFGILSVLCQTWSTPLMLFRVSPNSFYPRPSVESAVVSFKFDKERSDIPDEEFYRTVVRGTFGKRRKMLRTSLKMLFPGNTFGNNIAGVDLNRRPEDLTVDEFVVMSNRLHELFHL